MLRYSTRRGVNQVGGNTWSAHREYQRLYGREVMKHNATHVEHAKRLIDSALSRGGDQYIDWVY